jgi:hypothetical protein
VSFREFPAVGWYPFPVFAMPRQGFVFLATTKTASTAIENAFALPASVAFRHPPALKHMNVRRFHRQVAPILAGLGHAPGSYDVVCIVREPVDWISSWYRYRSRGRIASSPKYTGDLTFEEFAEQVMDGQIRLGCMEAFVRAPQGGNGVTRMFRYDRLDSAVAWMARRAGLAKPVLPHVNVSPSRDLVISRSVRLRLEEHLAPHAELYESAV